MFSQMLFAKFYLLQRLDTLKKSFLMKKGHELLPKTPEKGAG